MTFDKSYYSTGAYSDYEGLAKEQTESIIGSISSAIEISPQCTFLDVGCGLGYLVAALRNRKYDAWGIEVSDYCCQHSSCRQWITPASATDIPFPSNSFDIVISYGVLYYLKPPEIVLALNEIYRVCRVGCYLDSITSDSPNSDQQLNPDSMRRQENLLPTKEWENMLINAGFYRAPNFISQLGNPDFHGLFLKPVV